MARHARRLTISALDALRRKAESDRAFKAYVADAGQPGLYAWARRGRVRFVFAYRPPGGGARRRLKIDEYGAITLQQAREIAEDWRGMVAAGRDPQLEKRERVRRATTLDQVTQLYLEDLRERAESGAKRGKRSGYASAKNRLERHVLPKLGAVRVRDVTAEQVRRLHRALKETPVEANRTLTGHADRMRPDRRPAGRKKERSSQWPRAGAGSTG